MMSEHGYVLAFISEAIDTLESIRLYRVSFTKRNSLSYEFFRHLAQTALTFEGEGERKSFSIYYIIYLQSRNLHVNLHACTFKNFLIIYRDTIFARLFLRVTI